MPTDRLILAIDQGTSNTKAILVDPGGFVVAVGRTTDDIEYPQPGWVQQDADALWSSVCECVDEVLEVAGSPALAAIGISNQRESGVAWERDSGAPVGPVVTWQCRRSSELCDPLRAAGRAVQIQSRTGLPLDPGFTAGKWRWLLDAGPQGRSRGRGGRDPPGYRRQLAALEPDGWRGPCHRRQQCFTDTAHGPGRGGMGSLAGRDLRRAEGGVTADPAVERSVRRDRRHRSLGAGVPIGSLVGDSHAALFGHAGFEPGAIKATYGTGSSLMMPTPTRLASEAGLAATIAWGLDATVYALEGNINVTGAAVQWLADFVGLEGPAEVAQLAARTPSTEGIYLVPAFVGLGAPHWDDSARGLISGLTRGSKLTQLARAAIESIAYQVRDVFDAMQAASGGSLRVLMADGGVTRNEQLMQFQADILGVPVQRNDTAELSAMGAAYLAGLAVGVWTSLAEIGALPRSVDRFEPTMAAADRERLYAGWGDALARSTLHP